MKYKKHILLPGAMLIYAIIMTFYAYRQNHAWTQQMTISILIEVTIIIILYLLLKKRYDDMNR